MRELPCRVLLLLLAAWNWSYAQQTDQNGISQSGSVRTGSTTAGTTGTSSNTVTSSNKPCPTCPNRTANYITHTLPQQCLRTDRNANATQSTASLQDFAANTTTAIVQQITDATNTSSSGEQVVSRDSSVGTSQSSDLTSSTTTTAQILSPISIIAETPIASTVTDEATTDETDSPFDNANFLSFEEWKKQNLAKAGQSPEHLGQGHGQHFDGHRQRPGINNALDGLGEENEIELDFAGFGGAGKPSVKLEATVTADSAAPESGAPTAQALRSKDAGKTCKERTNYASFDCAATVLKTNPQCKSSSSVLVENKDSYMLNPCSADNKFFIVELCNDILIDTIVLANYEFFSSIFREFRISVSDRYPVKMEKWKHLGTFEARNTREVQAFLIENPLIWARYLRIEFLSHYGSEYYCPLSLLRVHGTTMLEEFRHQEELARGEQDEDSVLGVEAEAEAEAIETQAIPQEPERSTDESAKATVQSISSVEEAPETLTQSNSIDTSSATGESWTQETGMDPSPPPPVATPSNLPQVSEEFDATHANETTCAISATSASTGTTVTSKNDSTSVESIDRSKTEQPANVTSITTWSSQNSTQETSTSQFDSRTASPTSHSEVSPITPKPDSKVASEATSTSIHPDIVSTLNATQSSSQISPSPSTQSSLNKTTEVTSSQTSRPSALVRSVVTPISAPPAQPSTQESFFKSIHKRLQQLESNSTLSLQYIEEQSRILRDAFSKVEKRQLTSTSNFLTHLNESVIAELHGFRKAYDQLWQSTVLELEGQREQYQREMLALSSRLTLVADELVWQKRMGIAQATLLLLCLGLVLFSRGNGPAAAMGSVMEMPLYQQMRNRSQAALGGLRADWETPPASPPSPDRRSPAGLLRRKVWRAATDPLGGLDALASPPDSRPETKDGLEVDVVPPTPLMDDAASRATPPDEHGGDVELNPGAEGDGHSQEVDDLPSDDSHGGRRPMRAAIIDHHPG